jgi:hypothetical protein
MELIHALKEWAVAVDALEQGRTIMLLRKGGIREQDRSFTVAHDQVLLYPTYEHQHPHLLKSDYTSQVKPVTSGYHPSTVRISAWAQITHIFQVGDESTVAALLPYHIWNAQFASERFGWKPRSPLYVLLLRTYQLAQAQMISYRPEYGGCKSWIDLAEPTVTDESVPALSETEYAKQVTAIGRIIENKNSSAKHGYEKASLETPFTYS